MKQVGEHIAKVVSAPDNRWHSYSSAFVGSLVYLRVSLAKFTISGVLSNLCHDIAAAIRS